MVVERVETRALSLAGVWVVSLVAVWVVAKVVWRAASLVDRKVGKLAAMMAAQMVGY